MQEGVTVNEEFDEVTGLSRKVIVESRDSADLQPRVVMRDPDNHQVLKLSSSRGDARYVLPVGANIVVNDGDTIAPGRSLPKIPRETQKNKDIVGGLPRVAELFEARKPKEPAIITEIDGWVGWKRIPRASVKSLYGLRLASLRNTSFRKGKALAQFVR